jgi:hypothetical protein
MPYKDPDKRRAKAREYSRDWREANRERFAFVVQRSDAKKRGIPFLLTFEEWWAVWLASSKWDQRGKLAGQYVMARLGDRGPYEVGNVYICTTTQNAIDRYANLPDEMRRQIPHIGRGKRRNAEQRRRISEGRKAYFASKRSE